MERNMVLAVIFSAAAVVGAIEAVYQVYQLTVIDAAARGLKHPKLWGLLAANGLGEDREKQLLVNLEESGRKRADCEIGKIE